MCHRVLSEGGLGQYLQNVLLKIVLPGGIGILSPAVCFLVATWAFEPALIIAVRTTSMLAERNENFLKPS